MITRIAVNNCDYYCGQPYDVVAITGISKEITIQLCEVACLPVNALKLLILDESGDCNTVNSIIVKADKKDTINGQECVIIERPFGYIHLLANKENKWTICGE